MSEEEVKYNVAQCLKIGSVLNGKTKYTIKSILGQGGFGITYLVYTPEGEPRAVKEYYPRDYCERIGNKVECRTKKEVVEEFKDKFKKEVERIQLATHKNVIKTYDLFEANQTVYYVMEYAPGESLETFTDEVPEKQAVSYISDIAEAVAVLHQRRINHLDIKPENIVLRQNGEPVLIDFGIARGFDKTGKKQTSINNYKSSSQGYAPYEQYDGNGITEFSPQADIYALGATLYRLLTGQKPFSPEKYALREATLTFPLTVSKPVQDAIRYAMQYSKDRRPKNISEFLAVLNNICPAPTYVTANNANVLPVDDGSTRIEGMTSSSPVYTPPSQPTQPINPGNVTTPATNTKGNSNNMRNILVGVAIVAVGVLGYKYIDSNKSQDNIVQQDSISNVMSANNLVEAEQPTSPNDNQSRSKTKTVTSPNITQATNTSTSSPTSTTKAVEVKEQSIETTPTQTAPIQTPTPAVTEMTAEELLSKGISASKKFRYEDAASYFTKSANKGNITAMYLLGDLYYNGNGVDKSFPNAKKYFMQAANGGYVKAQYMLGVMFRNGQGGDKDINQAKVWLQKAASQGSSEAERMLDKL